MKESPNWLKIPHRLMVDVFQRLRTFEVLNNIQKVCTTWRIICKDPVLWNVIDINKSVDDLEEYHDLEMLTKQAVDLSCGELINISIEGFASYELVDYIVQCSSKLKSLSLTNCYNITSSELSHALKRVPQLEKLHLSYTSRLVEYIRDIVPNCPQLKSFKLDKAFIRLGRKSNHDAYAIAYNMPELRHLQVYGNTMTNIGLQAILNGCPHLESLDVRTCYNIHLRGKLGKLCMERMNNFKGPDDSTENCGFHPRIKYVL